MRKDGEETTNLKGGNYVPKRSTNSSMLFCIQNPSEKITPSKITLMMVDNSLDLGLDSDSKTKEDSIKIFLESEDSRKNKIMKIKKNNKKMKKKRNEINIINIK